MESPQTQDIKIPSETPPNLNTVVGKQTKLLGELSQLMASLDSTDPQSLERVNALLAMGIKCLRGEATITDSAATANLSVRRQDFMNRYGVTVLDDSKASFILPKGSSVLNLLMDAQALAPDLYNRDAIYHGRLIDWSVNKAFTSSVTRNTEYSINRAFADSTSKTRFDQKSPLETQKVELLGLEHLAAAHVVYLIATGNDLFAGNVARARDGALFFFDSGLNTVEIIGVRYLPGSQKSDS